MFMVCSRYGWNDRMCETLISKNSDKNEPIKTWKRELKTMTHVYYHQPTRCRYERGFDGITRH